MNLFRIILLLASTIGLSACVSTQSVANKLMAQYAGDNIDHFFITHGAPAGQLTLNDGDKLWTWDSGIRSIYMPSTTTVSGTNNGPFMNYIAHTSGGNSLNLQCVIQFLTTSQGIIEQIRIIKDTLGFWTTSECHEVL